MEQDGVVPMGLPHMFQDVILQGAEDRVERGSVEVGTSPSQQLSQIPVRMRQQEIPDVLRM